MLKQIRQNHTHIKRMINTVLIFDNAILILFFSSSVQSSPSKSQNQGKSLPLTRTTGDNRTATIALSPDWSEFEGVLASGMIEV